jgi:hypothetical protein
MRPLAAAFTLTILCACTYERAPRSGPIVAVADSMIPRDERLVCQQEEQDALPANVEPRRQCVASDTSGRFMEVGRWGRILAVTVNFPDDSVGQRKAQVLARLWTAESGQRPVAGQPHDGTTVEVWHWRTPSVCYSLVRGLRSRQGRWFRGYQVEWSLPERFGPWGCV